jgi:NADP-dependent 3-hydroxy-3-methylglutaryl-CoA reductase
LPVIPRRGASSEEARLQRLDWLAAQTRAPLHALRETRLRADALGGNVENLIGAVEVPVGIAGPLHVMGTAAQGLFYLPMATTEGALVSSATRGALALTRAGGVTAVVQRKRMTRTPFFTVRDQPSAPLLVRFIEDHLEALRDQVRQVSRHARLTSVEPITIGRAVHVHFHYECGDAAGQNMTTACTWHAGQWLLRELERFPKIRIDGFFIEGNMSGDKKLGFSSLGAGRGIRVSAEATIPGDLLQRVLKMTPADLVRLNQMAVTGSIQSGMVGYNINVANVIAAVFTATGQDIACVHESSVGLLHLQEVPEGVYASLLLPGLVIGTVGGGTHLPGQRALLEMMDCAGPGRVEKLAEIIAGFALALDLSTMCAIGGGQFVRAHERLGRNRPVSWFSLEDLTPGFFEAGLRESLNDPALEVRAVVAGERPGGESILTELAGRRVRKLVGLLPYRLEVTGREGDRAIDVVVKSKPLDEEILLVSTTMAQMAGPPVATAWGRHRDVSPFAGCHVRELILYQQGDSRFTRHAPRALCTFRDDRREAYVLVLERIADPILLDATDDPGAWKEDLVDAALRGIADVHAIWLGRERELAAQPWLGTPPSAARMAGAGELWSALLDHAVDEFPDLVSPGLAEIHREQIERLGAWWPRLERMPRTLIHHDFNPRNIAIRRDSGGQPRLCAYDWELATLHVPQRDLAELLTFTLDEDADPRRVDHHVEVHRRALQAASGRALDPVAWREGYALSLADLMVGRMAMYLLGHTYHHLGFLERAYRTLHRLFALERARRG